MRKEKRILVVDDEAHIRRILQVAFEKEKYAVHTAEDVPAAIKACEAHGFDCVLTDVTMPGRTGYELLEEVSERWPNMPVIIMTAFGTIPQAVKAMRQGAFEYLTKPLDLETLKKVVKSAIESGTPRARQSPAQSKGGFNFIAHSPAMLEVLETVKQVADSRATVLITGESGVGKEVVAKALHHFSCRSAEPFVAVSCAALPETLLESELFGYEAGAFTGAQGAKVGRFELANKGTLFLDEIGEIPLSIQVKLLRVLQEREFERLGATKPTKVDVRLVTATNRNLQQAVDEGIFRIDLLYRLQVVELAIPALRDRKEDIVPLAKFFLEKYCHENGRALLSLGDEAIEQLLAYSWPGNVRELENTMERAVVLARADAESISPKDLPNAIRCAA
jgi:two-component system response regulator AtoC